MFKKTEILYDNMGLITPKHPVFTKSLFSSWFLSPIANQKIISKEILVRLMHFLVKSSDCIFQFFQFPYENTEKLSLTPNFRGFTLLTFTVHTALEGYKKSDFFAIWSRIEGFDIILGCN